MKAMLRVAGQSISLEDATNRVLGYCLDCEPVRWTKPRMAVDINRPRDLDRGAHAYRTYDCVPASEGSTIEFIDIVVADGLNAMMRAKDIASVLAVSEVLGQLIERVDKVGRAFWAYDTKEVRSRPKNQTDRAWPLWAAWSLLMGVEGIDVARCHKILHHKRPAVFPLIDNQTLPWLSRGTDAWAAIHRDLTHDGVGAIWAELETQVNSALTEAGGRPLARLRLHDILLWLRATGRW